MRVSKGQAIRRLRTAGYLNVSEELYNFRNKRNNNWGWDGWLRGKFPELVHIVWS